MIVFPKTLKTVKPMPVTSPQLLRSPFIKKCKIEHCKSVLFPKLKPIKKLTKTATVLNNIYRHEKVMKNFRLIAGNSHPRLAESISKSIHVPLVSRVCDMFSNKEIRVEIKENIRNKDIFIVQTGATDNNSGFSVNDHIMETLILIDACRRSDVKSITLIMPCFPYARQDKKDEIRSSISGKLLANLIESTKIDRIIFMDLHKTQIQGFFDIPTDNVNSINIVLDYLNKTIFKTLSTEEKQNKYILVSPDAGATGRTLKFGKIMELDTIIMHKQRDYSKKNTVEKSILICEENNIRGKTAIICDDICDTGGTLISAAKTLKEQGIKDIICVFTHGIFSGPAMDRINNCPSIKKVIVSNSLPQYANQLKCDKIEVFDIGELMGDIIKKMHLGESVSSLF